MLHKFMFNHCAVHLSMRSIKSIKSIRFRVKNPVAWYQGTLIMFSSDYESFQIKSLKTSDQITTADYKQRGKFSIGERAPGEGGYQVFWIQEGGTMHDNDPYPKPNPLIAPSCVTSIHIWFIALYVERNMIKDHIYKWSICWQIFKKSKLRGSSHETNSWTNIQHSLSICRWNNFGANIGLSLSGGGFTKDFPGAISWFHTLSGFSGRGANTEHGHWVGQDLIWIYSNVFNARNVKHIAKV